MDEEGQESRSGEGVETIGIQGDQMTEVVRGVGWQKIRETICMSDLASDYLSLRRDSGMQVHGDWDRAVDSAADAVWLATTQHYQATSDTQIRDAYADPYGAW